MLSRQEINVFLTELFHITDVVQIEDAVTFSEKLHGYLINIVIPHGSEESFAECFLGTIKKYAPEFTDYWASNEDNKAIILGAVYLEDYKKYFKRNQKTLDVLQDYETKFNQFNIVQPPEVYSPYLLQTVFLDLCDKALTKQEDLDILKSFLSNQQAQGTLKAATLVKALLLLEKKQTFLASQEIITLIQTYITNTLTSNFDLEMSDCIAKQQAYSLLKYLKKTHLQNVLSSIKEQIKSLIVRQRSARYSIEPFLTIFRDTDSIIAKEIAKEKTVLVSELMDSIFDSENQVFCDKILKEILDYFVLDDQDKQKFTQLFSREVKTLSRSSVAGEYKFLLLQGLIEGGNNDILEFLLKDKTVCSFLLEKKDRLYRAVSFAYEFNKTETIALIKKIDTDGEILNGFFQNYMDELAAGQSNNAYTLSEMVKLDVIKPDYINNALCTVSNLTTENYHLFEALLNSPHATLDSKKIAFESACKKGQKDYIKLLLQIPEIKNDIALIQKVFLETVGRKTPIDKEYKHILYGQSQFILFLLEKTDVKTNPAILTDALAQAANNGRMDLLFTIYNYNKDHKTSPISFSSDPAFLAAITAGHADLAEYILDNQKISFKGLKQALYLVNQQYSNSGLFGSICEKIEKQSQNSNIVMLTTVLTGIVVMPLLVFMSWGIQKLLSKIFNKIQKPLSFGDTWWLFGRITNPGAVNRFIDWTLSDPIAREQVLGGECKPDLVDALRAASAAKAARDEEKKHPKRKKKELTPLEQRNEARWERWHAHLDGKTPASQPPVPPPVGSARDTTIPAAQQRSGQPAAPRLSDTLGCEGARRPRT